MKIEGFERSSDFARAVDRLEEELGQGGDDGSRPDRLVLERITELPEVFQVRGGALSEHHLGDLGAALARRGRLDRVKVWVCGTSIYLVDGHHRLEAYRRHGQKAGMERVEVPVTYVEGSPKAALQAAAGGNTKAKLPMDNRERQNLGWRLVLSRKFSIAEIAEMAAISTGNVSNMRKVMKELGNQAHDQPTWLRALMATKEDQWTPERVDDLMEAEAQGYAARLVKEFSTKLAHRPEVTARALMIHLGERSAEIIHEWRQLAEYDPLVFEEDEDGPMF